MKADDMMRAKKTEKYGGKVNGQLNLINRTVSAELDSITGY